MIGRRSFPFGMTYVQGLCQFQGVYLFFAVGKVLKLRSCSNTIWENYTGWLIGILILVYEIIPI